jgi:plastocyanin
MNIRRLLKSLIATGTMAAVIVAGVGHVSAAQIDYHNPNNQKIQTPRFNGYTNVPAVGNEADFVRLRNSTGDPTVSATQSNFIDPLNDDCKVGDKYDIRTYVHNIANDEFNGDGGNGSAVAHNVTVRMQAPLNTTDDRFTFTSNISASNAATVTDTGRLNCGQDVRLKLVPQTVKVFSTNTGWNSAPDSAVNGSLRIGSEQVGSGDVWGCWQHRVVVVYVVEVVKKPTPPKPSRAVCDLLSLTVVDSRKVRARVSATTQNATILGYRINWGDNNVSNEQEDEHTYAEAGNYTIVGSVRVRYANGTEEWITSDACKKKVTFKEEVENCPLPGKEHLPVDSPECKEVPPVKGVTTPTVLPSTGPAEVLGMFAATTIAGAIAYNVVYRKFYN